MGDARTLETGGAQMHVWFAHCVNVGSIGRYPHHLIANFKNTRATMDESFNPTLGASAPASLRVVTVPWFRPVRVRGALNSALNEFCCMLDKPDVLHLPHYPAPGWVWRMQRRGVKVVYTVHDLIPELLIHPDNLCRSASDL